MSPLSSALSSIACSMMASASAVSPSPSSIVPVPSSGDAICLEHPSPTPYSECATHYRERFMIRKSKLRKT